VFEAKLGITILWFSNAPYSKLPSEGCLTVIGTEGLAAMLAGRSWLLVANPA
jgi:hypothetical protein